MLFGLAPALRATRVAPIDALKEHSRSAAGDQQGTLSGGVIVAQVAVSLMLVVAAGLFVRTFERLGAVSLGFDRDRVLAITVTAPTIPAADRNSFYHRLVRAAAALPGVVAAGGSLNPPITIFYAGERLSIPGAAPGPNADTTSQFVFMIPGWLAAYGTPVRTGRDIDDRDTASALPVMLVNEAFVRKFFPGRNLIGTALALTVREPPLGNISLGSKTVVGIVGDAVYRSLREPVPPTIYFPLAQRDGPLLYTTFYLAVRSPTDSPSLLTRSVAAALTSVNPDLRLTFRPVSEQVEGLLAQDRLLARLSGFFGVLALLLAGVGLYGVTAYCYRASWYRKSASGWCSEVHPRALFVLCSSAC